MIRIVVDYGYLRSSVAKGSASVSVYGNVVWSGDVREALSEHARWCAAQVAHLWGPSPAALRWIVDGDGLAMGQCFKESTRWTSDRSTTMCSVYAALSALASASYSPSLSSSNSARDNACIALCWFNQDSTLLYHDLGARVPLDHTMAKWSLHNQRLNRDLDGRVLRLALPSELHPLVNSLDPGAEAVLMDALLVRAAS